MGTRRVRGGATHVVSPVGCHARAAQRRHHRVALGPAEVAIEEDLVQQADGARCEEVREHGLFRPLYVQLEHRVRTLVCRRMRHPRRLRREPRRKVESWHTHEPSCARLLAHLHVAASLPMTRRAELPRHAKVERVVGLSHGVRQELVSAGGSAALDHGRFGLLWQAHPLVPAVCVLRIGFEVHREGAGGKLGIRELHQDCRPIFRDASARVDVQQLRGRSAAEQRHKALVVG